MGFCMDKHGRVSIETRRESFKIHREYTNDALGRQWRECPHPEFMLTELDDLIAALVEARARLTGKAEPQFRTVTLTREMIAAHCDKATGWASYIRVDGDGRVSLELLRPTSRAVVGRFVSIDRRGMRVDPVSEAFLTAQWCPLDGDNRIAPWEAP